MKRTIVLVLLAAIMALAGYGIFRVFDKLTPPDFARTGGTILVYEVDAQDVREWDAARLHEAILLRLDPENRLGIRVAAAGKDRVEIRIPHPAGDAKQVGQVKDLMGQAGTLEFRILANDRDDKDALAIMVAWFEEGARFPEADQKARQSELESRAKRGLPPPGPEFKGNRSFAWSTGHGNGWATYSWIELDPAERLSHGLGQNSNPPDRWQAAADARTKGVPLVVDTGRLLLYSRPCLDLNLPPEVRKAKGFDYFFLARDPPPEKQVSGKHLQAVHPGLDAESRPAINFTLDKTGGNLFLELTTANQPSDEFYRRHLAIILDDRIVTSPTLNSPIGTDGQISGPTWTVAEVDTLIRVLRAGALPVKLKRWPVEERAVAPGGEP